MNERDQLASARHLGKDHDWFTKPSSGRASRMNQVLFEQYEAAKAQGNKRLSTSLLACFIETFETDEQREAWTRWYFDHRPVHFAVRHELFERVIFPVLLTGYQRSDSWSLEMLERCSQNLYKAEHLWAQIDHQTQRQLAERLLELQPDDPRASARVLAHLIAGFRYSEHEWPAGILDGANGATAHASGEILLEVHRARALDVGGMHTAFLDQYDEKVRQYIQRLSNQRAGSMGTDDH
jgi:hypothetical protein